MMNRLLMTALALSGLALAATPLIAHHSFAAQYDRAKQATLTGPVVRVDWINPHARFFLEVKDAAGNVEKWAFEAGTPSGMIRNGFKPGLIKAGTEVTIKGIRARDASQKVGLLRELITPDGKVYGTFGSEQAK